MSIGASRVIMQEAFETAWSDQTPIAWDNVKYKSESSTFVRFSVQYDDGEQASLGPVGGRLFRHFGMILIQFFTKLNESPSENHGYAQDVLDFFTTPLAGVNFKNPSVKSVGVDGNYYQQNVSAEFYIEQTT